MFSDFETILEIFVEAQHLGDYSPVSPVGKSLGVYATAQQLSFITQGNCHLTGKSRKERDEKQKAALRAYAAKRAEDDIRQRLLDGERPVFSKFTKPKRWIRLAKELGIEFDFGWPSKETTATKEAA